MFDIVFVASFASDLRGEGVSLDRVPTTISSFLFSVCLPNLRTDRTKQATLLTNAKKDFPGKVDFTAYARAHDPCYLGVNGRNYYAKPFGNDSSSIQSIFNAPAYWKRVYARPDVDVFMGLEKEKMSRSQSETRVATADPKSLHGYYPLFVLPLDSDRSRKGPGHHPSKSLPHEINPLCQIKSHFVMSNDIKGTSTQAFTMTSVRRQWIQPIRTTMGNGLSRP